MNEHTRNYRAAVLAVLARPEEPCKCGIQWVDDNGKPTPDNNPAIGRVQRDAFTETFHGRAVHFDASESFPICADHLRVMQSDPAGFHRWTFIPFI